MGLFTSPSKYDLEDRTAKFGENIVEFAKKIPYYLCKVRLTEKGIRQLGDRHLQPGMPVQVIVKMGQRTMMGYLIKPLFDRISVTFKER